MAEGETFAYLTFPKLPPEKAAGDYLQSKLEEQALKKYPQWDYPRTEPTVNLVAAKRELHHAQNQLAEKQEEAISRRENLDLQWENLDDEAVKLRQTFREFDKMIKQNSQKRERAAAKTEKQVVLQAERDRAIKELQVEHDKLTKIRDEMDNQIRNHSMYEEYLQTVADMHPEYNTPKNVFNKFGTLDEARNALTERLDENLTTLENLKDEMLQLMKSQNSVLIGLNNRVADLYERHSAAKAKAQKWEEIVQKIQNESREKLVEILSVKKSCWNVYLEICARKRVKPQLDKSDFESHLWFIRKTILKLKRTLEIAQQKKEADVTSICVERPVSKRRL